MSEKRYVYITPEDYEIAESNGISKKNVYNRVHSYGWDIDRAITQPVRNTENSLFRKWRDKAVVSHTVFLNRLQRLGWDEEKAAMTPKVENKGVITEEIRKLAESNGITESALKQRIYTLKWDTERAVTTPLMSKSESAAYGLKVRHGKRGIGRENQPTSNTRTSGRISNFIDS